VIDKVLAAYSKLAQDYEKNVDTTSGYNAYYERPAMMKQFPSEMTGSKVLDAGCAAGWYTEQFLQRGADVTAIDISPEMVEATKRRIGQQSTVLTHDLTKPFPFDNGTFDYILCSLTLHYLDDWTPTFKEFNRLMKPGGKFVFSVHHPFMDFKLFDRPDYFAHEWLEEVWNKKESGRVEVTFSRRPLSEVINAVTPHFILEQIIEPQPVDEFKEKLPHKATSYDYLMKNPHFLIVVVHKQNF